MRGYTSLVAQTLFALSLITVGLGMKHLPTGLEMLEVYPARIPAGSPETLIDIFSFNLADVQTAKVNGISLPFARVGNFQISAMISSDLIRESGHLTMILETSPGKSPFEPVDIEVFPRKHAAELTIQVSKSTVTSDETFSLSLTVTNRSPYALYFARQIEPFVSGGPSSMYSLEIRPLSSRVFYVPKRVSVTAGALVAKTADEYAAAGLLIRLEPGQTHSRSLNLKVADLTQGLFSGTVPSGTYVIRALYAGVELPLKTAQTSVLDERLYSNQVQLNVGK